MVCHGNDLVLGGPCANCGQPRHPGQCVPVVDTAAVRLLIEKAGVASRGVSTSEPEDGYPPGTWLRWVAGGALKIGVVQYVREHAYPSTAGRWSYTTDAGTVNSNAILEAR
jgi:hypothetical protein